MKISSICKHNHNKYTPKIDLCLSLMIKELSLGANAIGWKSLKKNHNKYILLVFIIIYLIVLYEI